MPWPGERELGSNNHRFTLNLKSQSTTLSTAYAWMGNAPVTPGRNKKREFKVQEKLSVMQ